MFFIGCIIAFAICCRSKKTKEKKPETTAEVIPPTPAAKIVDEELPEQDTFILKTEKITE